MKTAWDPTRVQFGFQAGCTHDHLNCRCVMLLELDDETLNARIDQSVVRAIAAEFVALALDRRLVSAGRPVMPDVSVAPPVWDPMSHHLEVKTRVSALELQELKELAKHYLTRIVAQQLRALSDSGEVDTLIKTVLKDIVREEVSRVVKDRLEDFIEEAIGG